MDSVMPALDPNSRGDAPERRGDAETRGRGAGDCASDLPAPSPRHRVPASPCQHSAARQLNIPWLHTWTFLLGLAAVAATGALFAGNGHGRGLFIGLICLETLLLAALFDAATGRIPNPITYTGILLGLSLNAVALTASRAAPAFQSHWLGAAGPIQSLQGILVFGGIGLVSRAFAGMGGGDMKLLAAVGALLGSAWATEALFCALAVAVVYALANLVVGGRLNAATRTGSAAMLAALFPRAAFSVGAHRRRTFPLALPMFLGLLLWALPPVAPVLNWLRGM